MSNSYSLMIHGGAGALEDLKHEASEATFHESITAILEQGRERLERGDSALDVVEYCASLLENDRLYHSVKYYRSELSPKNLARRLTWRQYEYRFKFLVAKI